MSGHGTVRLQSFRARWKICISVQIRALGTWTNSTAFKPSSPATVVGHEKMTCQRSCVSLALWATYASSTSSMNLTGGRSSASKCRLPMKSAYALPKVPLGNSATLRNTWFYKTQHESFNSSFCAAAWKMTCRIFRHRGRNTNGMTAGRKQCNEHILSVTEGQHVIHLKLHVQAGLHPVFNTLWVWDLKARPTRTYSSSYYKIYSDAKKPKSWVSTVARKRLKYTVSWQ